MHQASVLIFAGLFVVFLAGVASSQSLGQYAKPCGGQGIVYAENFTLCECFDCFYGDSCEKVVENCNVNVAGGNPTLLQEFWANVKGLDAGYTSSQPYYRSPYDLMGGLIHPAPVPAFELDKYVRSAIVDLHEKVGNAKTDGKFIVYGTGGTQLINAAAYALASLAGKKVPHYQQYQAWAQFNALNNEWNPSYDQAESATEVIEFVTAPNNPTGVMRTPHYVNSTNLVYDMVYYWPSWTVIEEEPADHDIMLFSLSKLTGHAGTRFGWALIKDIEVAREMRSFINLMNIHVSIDSQHRAVRMLNAMQEVGDEFFGFLSSTMEARYERLQPLFIGQTTYRVESVTEPAWFYMWIAGPEGCDMEAILSDALITGESGTGFGSPANYARLQLTLRSVDFEIFFERFVALLYPDEATRKQFL